MQPVSNQVCSEGCFVGGKVSRTGKLTNWDVTDGRNKRGTICRPTNLTSVAVDNAEGIRVQMSEKLTHDDI
jgi:hypothetical protein